MAQLLNFNTELKAAIIKMDKEVMENRFKALNKSIVSLTQNLNREV